MRLPFFTVLLNILCQSPASWHGTSTRRSLVPPSFLARNLYPAVPGPGPCSGEAACATPSLVGFVVSPKSLRVAGHGASFGEHVSCWGPVSLVFLAVWPPCSLSE